jgi:DNA (cytosine-5)-methyltransferase 1
VLENTQNSAGFKYRNGAKARGIGYADEQSPTLETSQNVAIYDLTHHDEVVREIHGNKTQTLKARAGTGGNNTPIVFEPGIASRDGGHVYNGTAPTLRANPGDNAPAICLNDQGGSVMDVSDKAGTLRAESHGHEPCVCIAGNIIDRQVQNGGNGVGAQKDISYTLNTIDRHAVCYSFDSKASNSMKSSNPHSGCREVEVSKCLDTTTPDPSKNQGGVAIVGYRASGFQGYSEDSVAGTLRAQGGTLGGGSETFVTQKTVGCLNADDYKGINNQYVSQGKLVIDNGRNVR